MSDSNRSGNTSGKGFFRRLISQSGVYAIGNLLIKASGILLAPIYLNPEYLSEVEYGVFALLEVTGQISVLVIGLGLHAALIKFMSDQGWREMHRAVPFTVLVTVVGSAAAICAALYSAGPTLSAVLLGGAERTSIFQLFVVYIGIKSLLIVPYTLLRFRERAGIYVTASVSEIGLLIAAVYFFVVEMSLGLEGVVFALIVSSGVTAIILLTASLTSIKFQFHRGLAGTLIRFGVPLAIGGLAMPILHAGDRYLIEWLMDTTSVAVYTWGTRISGILNMLFVQSFNLAFMVVGLKSLGSGAADHSLHRRTLRHFSAGAAWCALALAVLAADITRLLGAGALYLGADELVFYLSMGFFSYGIYMILVNVLYSAGRTTSIAVLVVAATVSNVLFNLVLIPLMGTLGAALATLSSYILLAALTYMIARREASIDYDWRSVLTCVVAAVVLYSLALWLPDTSLAGRVGIVAAYAPAIILLRVYTYTEIKRGAAEARKLLRKLR